ncbi:MAG: ATP-dependent zinc metalloprotease FtsH [Planctomycetaceae bacterium]|nr:ATP-dependent zinc metalloprotease FtsH [Planctomycetaceae bacterium]
MTNEIKSNSETHSEKKAPENREQQNSKPPKKSQNDPFPKIPRPEGGGMSFLMIAAIVIVVICLLNLLTLPKRNEIALGDLLRLIDQGVNNSQAVIEVKEGKDKNEMTVHYSDVKEIVITPYEVAGTVTREIIAPENKKKKPAANTKFTAGRLGLNDDNFELVKRLEKAGFNYRALSRPNFWEMHASSLIFFLMMLASIPLIFIMFRKMASSGAMAFSRNRGRQVSQEDVEVTFNDVAGVDEAVEELKEIVEFLKTPEKFQVLGGRIPKGVLLFGPPGTGKTLLAKAVAGEAGVPFISLSGSDFVELYVGVGAARVRDLFEQAQRRSPCIIFIDELDAIGKTRGNSNLGSNEERDQTLNALLVEMDGFNADAGTIVMASTNRPETLDSALLRPGRFDRHVLVDRPDIRGREEILKVHTRKVKLDGSIDLRAIASITSGFAGADLAALVNEAALLAARVNKKAVTMEEFNEAAERVTSGLKKKRHAIRPDEKLHVAYHESGHAMVAYLLPAADTVHKISIIPRGAAALGYTLQRPEDDRYLMTREELECRIQVFLAGTLAEEMIFGSDKITSGAQNDLERATELARCMVMDFGMSRLGRINYRENPRSYIAEQRMLQSRLHSEQTAWEIDQEIKTIMEEMLQRTKTTLEERRDTLTKLAEYLLEKEVMDTDELTAIVEGKPIPVKEETLDILDELEIPEELKSEVHTQEDEENLLKE